MLREAAIVLGLVVAIGVLLAVAGERASRPVAQISRTRTG